VLIFYVVIWDKSGYKNGGGSIRFKC